MSAKPSYWDQLKEGLWNNNVVFGQLLALCPLLAVTSSATNGLGMGLITTVVIVMSNLVISLCRQWITPQVRIPVFTLLIAGLVTLVDQAMNAYLHDLHKVLGLFIPLIVTNCAILGRAEAYASKNAWLPSAVDGLATGLGFTFALVTLGAVREIIGGGTLFKNASGLLGSSFGWMELSIGDGYRGFLLMLLPAGGFIMLGILLCLRRVLESYLAERRAAQALADTQ